MSFGVDVCGYAYILEHNKSLSEVLDFINTDTILVLPQMCPEHIPHICICKGIIVDEPGIAGHASKIAREIKKSAIIGTVNGTRRIKNGEYVCLDIKACCVKRINYV
jgi:phosphohistidine swiveling domain-containing protein